MSAFHLNNYESESRKSLERLLVNRSTGQLLNSSLGLQPELKKMVLAFLILAQCTFAFVRVGVSVLERERFVDQDVEKKTKITHHSQLSL